MDIKTMLKEELESELEELSKTQTGTDEYLNLVNGIAKLNDQIIKYESIESEERIKMKQVEAEIAFKADENALKRDDIKENTKREKIKNGVTILTLTVGVCMALVSLKFEEDHSLNNIPGRKILNNLLNVFK